MENIGEFLRQKRKEKGLSQIELAQKSKVSTMSIRRYESNERSPKADELAKFGTVLGFDVEFKEGVSIIVHEKMDDDKTVYTCMFDVDYDELDKLLANRGISRRQLAAMIGISPDTLAGSFRRKGRMNINSIRRIADSLNTNVESFSSVSSSDCDSSEKYEVYKLDSLLADLVSQLNSDGYEKMIDAVQVLLKVPEFRKDFVKDV